MILITLISVLLKIGIFMNNIKNIKFPETRFNLFVDVGLSYNAPFSIEKLNEDKNSFVIGIEPNPDNCRSIRSKGINDRFQLIEAGIGDVGKREDKFLELNMMYPDPGTSSFLEPTINLLSLGYKVTNKVKVRIISLESILDLVPWHLVNNGLFELKSDTQGFETQVLKSLGSYINKIEKLQIESTTWGQYKNACNLDEIKDILDPHMIMTKCDGGNAWFVKR